ncbi:MAG: shikimate dehydrogenase [Methanobacteriota archaeon]
MSARGQPDIFAVAGRPVLHSLSPQMHNAAFDRLGIRAAYIRLASEISKAAVRTLKRMDARGFNVTSPYKVEMLRLVDKVDSEAGKIGAVNTVCVKNGTLTGHNTDAHGAVEALRANSVCVGGANILVMGAGGAARAAVFGLMGAGAKVTVANRTAAKAAAIAREFGCSVSPAKSAIEKTVPSCSAIVSCSGGADVRVPIGALSKGMTVMDADYRRESALVRDARKAGCNVVDGREWLLHQGAKAFELFTGRDAPLDTMRDAIYSRETGNRGNGISLIGFMGAGKSAVGKELAKRLRLPSIDTDADIAREAGMTINEIFRKRGEAGFRKLERKRISILAGSKPSVVATGGGSILDAENVRALKDHGTVVFLWADGETLGKRLTGKDDRPLLSGRRKQDGPAGFLGLLPGRTPIYLESADIVVDSNGSTSKIAEVIAFETREAM